MAKVNVVNESANFNKKVYGDKSIDNFLIHLQHLVASCDYQDQDRHVKDHIIATLWGQCQQSLQ